MQFRFLRFLVVLGFALAFVHDAASGQSESSPVVYTIIDLGSLAHPDQDQCYGVSPGASVNDVGLGDRAVGSVYLEGERAVAAMFSDEPPRTMVSGPGGGVANAINVEGEIAGAVFDRLPEEPCGEASGSRPVIWNSDFRSAELELPEGSVSGAGVGINRDGTVAGWIETDEGRRAAIWSEDEVKIAQHVTIEGMAELSSQAVGINDDGVVAGTLSWTSDGVLESQAFLWDGEQIRYLEPLLGLTGVATAINNAGVVSGTVTNASGVQQAVLWWRGQIVTLGPLDDRPHAVATDVNNAGFAVGFGQRDDGLTRAMFWIGGTPFDLNDVVAGEGGWLLQMATGINDDGVIAGWGDYDGERRGFLLVPAVG